MEIEDDLWTATARP